MIDHWTPERTSYIARCMFVLALVSIALNQAKGEAVFSTAQLCTGITSVHNIQDVIAAEALGQSVCIIFTGDEGGEVWKLEDSPALNIRENQYVYIDCGGRYFNYHSKKGELTMGKGSTLHYYNCSLLDYEFPDSNRVYGTVHAITSSVIGMQACQVVKELGDQYAPALTAVQSNASFETGRLIDNANGSAVYIFLAAFDSLKGPQFRYEVTDSTMYCKSMNSSVPDAIQAANEFGPDVVLYSLDVSSQSSGLDKSLEDSQGVEGSNGGSDSKLWAFGVVAGVAVVVLGLAGYLLWYVKHKLGAKGPGPGTTDGTRYLAKHYGTSRGEVVSTSQMGPTSGSIDGRRYVPPNQ